MPKITLLGETLRHLRNGDSREAATIWRHEGLKDGLDFALRTAARTAAGRKALRRITGAPATPDRRLQTQVGNLVLAGPCGWGAGGNKTGKQLLADQALGARFHIVGGITLDPQSGKPMPRLRTWDKRAGDHGSKLSLNAFGFPNVGAQQTANIIAKQRSSDALTTPVLTQIAVPQALYEPYMRHCIPANIEASARILAPQADALGLGLSSPNVQGMRGAQQFSFLRDCIDAAQQGASAAGRELFILLKGDGDGGEQRLDMYCELVRHFGRSALGLELINTTALAHIKGRYGAQDLPGGLAGQDEKYRDMARNAVGHVYAQLDRDVDIIGCGGITTANDAWDMLSAGACAVTILTARRSQGLGAIAAVEQGLLRKLDTTPDVVSLTDIIGRNA